MKTILLISIGLSMGLYADFSTDGNVVTDDSTSLVWQDDYSDNGGEVKEEEWSYAITYCKELDLSGYRWRLPNLNELASLLDDTKHNPSIDDNVFQYTEEDYYWSSTTYSANTSDARLISFKYGLVSSLDKSGTKSIRCVSDLIVNTH